MPLGKVVGLGPGHIVSDGNQWGASPPQQPLSHFRPMPIAAKRSPISATAELLLLLLLLRRFSNLYYKLSIPPCHSLHLRVSGIDSPAELEASDI